MYAVKAKVGTRLEPRVRREQLLAAGAAMLAEMRAVESWLAFVHAACVKWIDSQTISRDNVTKMCLRAFDCTLDIPMSTNRLRARISEVMQSLAISSLIRKSRSATSARVEGVRRTVMTQLGSWPHQLLAQHSLGDVRDRSRPS